MENKKIKDEIICMAKKCKKTIVLPESEDVRVLKAASIITKEKIANVILIGNEKQIKEICDKNNIELEGIVIEDNLKSNKKEKYVQRLVYLREKKGMTNKKALEILEDKVYYATMMVEQNDADGMVSGAIHTTSDTLRPALQIIKAREDLNSVSSFFIMETQNKKLGMDGKYIFSDCGLIINPTEDELVDIVMESYDSFKQFIEGEPKIAMLSYSTKGSAKTETELKVKNVIERVRNKNNNILIDGELQLDSAIIPEVSKLKSPDSVIKGNANILIFPNLYAGNIGYKIAQRFGNMVALGPITQGLKKPVNDLSRGCSVDDIVGVVAITCVQASNN